MSLIYILMVAAGIGLLVLAHEFGHFVFAKLSGVRVENFSVGFGPEIAGYTRGETRYSLRAFPLGGFVKMLGDEPGSAEASSERSFLAQSYWKKVLIIVAGSMANILLSMVLFMAAFRMGVEFPAAHIGDIQYGSPAYYAGIERGDRIVGIEGRGDVDFYDVTTSVALADPGQGVKLMVERGGETFERLVYPVFSAELGRGQIGAQPYRTLTVDGFQEFAVADGEGDEAKAIEVKSPSKAAGVARGSKIVAVNGEGVETWWDFERKLVWNGMKAYTLTVEAEGTRRDFEIKPVRNPAPLMGIIRRMTTVVTKVSGESLAAEMGLAVGDEISGLGEAKVRDLQELSVRLAEKLDSLPGLMVLRGEEEVELTWPRRPRSGAEFLAGFETVATPVVASVLEASAAEMMGLASGDLITEVAGVEVEEFVDVWKALRGAKSEVIEVKWERGGTEMTGSFEPALVDINPAAEMVMRKLGFVAACRVGAMKAWDFASQVYLIIRKAVTRQPGIGKNVGGPVSIVAFTYRIAQTSFARFVFFLAVLSVNLGVVNLLPIPILDGGHLAIFTVEKIKGSPLSQRMMAGLQYAGLAIILALFIFVTYNDIIRVFG